MTREKASFAGTVIAGFMIACAMLLLVQPCGEALASTSTPDNASGSETDASAEPGNSETEKAEGPLDWIFGLLFGNSSGTDVNSQSADAASPSSASSEADDTGAAQTSPSDASASSTETSSATAADPFSGPVESETEAINRIHDCLMRAGKELPAHITCETMTDEGRYLVRGYEIIVDSPASEGKDEVSHETNWFWYSVGKDGSIYDEVMMCEIDPLTMEESDTDQQTSIPENDYYTLSLPAELADAHVKYEEGSLGGPTSVGAITTVMQDGQIVFEVVCFSDDWGPQGTMGFEKLGSPSTDPHCLVFVTVPAKDLPDGGYGTEAAAEQAREYASYVTLK